MNNDVDVMKRTSQSQSDEQHGRPAAEHVSHIGKAATLVGQRPEPIVRRKPIDAIQNSPFLVKQRKQLSNMFGDVAQLNGKPGQEMKDPYDVLEARNKRGTQEAAVIQHALSDPVDFKTDRTDDKDLNQISAEVEIYNTLPVKEQSVPVRLHSLQQISRLLYSWYNRQDTYELGSLDSPIAKIVRQYEKEVEQELTKVVETASGKAAPIDRLNLGEGEQISIDKVWQDLLSGKGYLKIAGPAEFQKRVQAMLFRILNTEAGRKLLIQIAAGGKNKKTVTIGPGDIPPNIKNLLFESSTQESKAIPQIYSSSWSWASKNEKALMHRLTEMIKVVDPKAPDEFQTVENPEDLHRAINSGAKGIKAGKKPHETFYQFAEGAKGAYVALVENRETLDNAGKDKKAIHTPAFVTLAHELGHALNQLAGAATINNEEIFRILAGSREEVGTFEDPGPARKNWSNAEELFTILGLENAIRRQVGLAERGAHAGAVDPTLIQKLNAEKQLVLNVLAAVTDLGEELFKTKKDAVREKLYNLYSLNVKGISQIEKRERCNEYENAIKEVSEENLKKAGWEKILEVLRSENNKQHLETLELYLPDLAK
jgi:hypothetical protein